MHPFGCYWIQLATIAGKRAGPVTNISNDSKFIDLLLDHEHSLCAGINLNISHLEAKPLSIFLRALENIGGTPSRDDAPSSSILLQDANYQQQNCQRSISAVACQPSPPPAGGENQH